MIKKSIDFNINFKNVNVEFNNKMKMKWKSDIWSSVAIVNWKVKKNKINKKI